MHIPDGYLSPSTCACFYGACAPFWYRCLAHVRRVRQSQMTPLLALFAAFSFVLMMFNLPLPGGTTGHAVGVGIAAIVLGPAAAVIAISMALLIQALFFGDGGVTAYGANCFNMAVVGSFVAAGVYRLLAWNAEPQARRKIWAAGLAGYAAVNAAALCAAIEFGVQPAWFHDSAGVPLYAPYPLSIAVPAMMIGHLTIAGVAEFAITAGLFAYLQKSRPEMVASASGRGLKGLWVVLATLLLITPLGIVAVGTAWGEWKSTDFADRSARAQVAAASGNVELPAQVPEGLRRLTGLWRAPLAEYAPSFIQSRSVGYLASAVGGVVLVVGVFHLLAPLWQRRRSSVFQRSMKSLLRTMEETLFAEQSWGRNGFLQRSDARLKIGGAAVLLIAAVVSSSLPVLAVLLVGLIAAAFASRVPVFPALLRIWLGVLAFTGLIALPALFLVPGGGRSVALLVLRAETMSTMCGLLLLTTSPGSLLRALRGLHVPMTAVTTAGMAYRYLFLFAESASNLFEAREARSLGRVGRPEARRANALIAGTLLDKVFHLSEEVNTAMAARGYREDGMRAGAARDVEQARGATYEVRSASFGYNDRLALEDVDLTVASGERLALLGANGSGKSTLLRLLGGLSFAQAGAVRFGGETLDAERLEDEEFFYGFRQRVGIVFQNSDAQLFNPSVFDEVAFGLEQLRLSKNEVRERVEQSMELLGIAELRQRAPHRLSGGEKKRVALASVLVMQPEVLLLDEPTAGLDPKSQAQILELLASWRGGSKTIVVATHELDTLEEIADRCCLLSAGRIAACEKPLALLHDLPLLERTGLIRPHRHTHAGTDVRPHGHVHASDLTEQPPLS